MRLILLHSALLFCFVNLFAKTISTNRIRFDHLNIEHGLSQNTVNTILKDSHGYMWFGTNDGLNKYDGYSFKVYRQHPDDSTTISNSKIFSIVEDRHGNIWIATANGLNRYNRKTDDFEKYFKDKHNINSLSHNYVRTIFTDQDGLLYLGTLGGGLNIFDPEKKLFRRCSNKIDGLDLSIEHITSIIKDRQGNLLLGGNINGILWYHPATDMFTTKTYNGLVPAKTDHAGRTIFEDSHGDIWLCTEGDGVYQWQRASDAWRHFDNKPVNLGLSGNVVKSIYEAADGKIWLIIDGGGLNILDKESGEVETIYYHPDNPKGLSSNALYTIYSDPQNILWIGTFDSGIDILNPEKKKFDHYTQNGRQNALSHKSVLCFLEEREDIIWIGTDGGGLNRFDKKNNVFASYGHHPLDPASLSSNVITSLFQDSDKNMWIGTFQGGLMQYQGNGRFKSYRANDESGLENDNVWDILEDSKGTFWVATLGGLYTMDRLSGKFTRIRDEREGQEARLNRNICLMEDDQGNIWVGGNGISVYNPHNNTWKYYQHTLNDSTSLGVDNVRSIFMDSRLRIWIGTEGAGLNLFHRQTNSFSKWTSDDLLPNNSVHQMLEDDEGNLWISTNKGLSRISIGADGSLSIKNFDANDGLQSNQFSYSAAIKCASGEMYFGGINGFNSFCPAQITDNPYAPPVKISGFKINEQEVEIGSDGPLPEHISIIRKITLSHRQSRVFSFEFTALNFTSPEKNKYAYRMIGFDDEDTWLYSGNKRTATYTNLNAGTYVFEVKASNNDGIWNPETATLEIEVLPPLWKTWYAYLAYAGLLISISLSMRSITVERIHLKNDIRMKELEKQKNNALNQEKLKFFTSVSHEFKTPLTLIIGPLKKLMEDFKDHPDIQFYHTLMYQNAKRLLRLINQLMDFRKLENGKEKLQVEQGDIVGFIKDIKTAFENLAWQNKITFLLNSQDQTVLLYFDRNIIDKVFYNLLSNAFKFTPAQGRISIDLSSDNRMLSISVSDTGNGIPADAIPYIFDRYYHLDSALASKTMGESGSGIGLALCYELIKMHHGNIAVQSCEGQGSKFTVSLPIGQNAYSPEELLAKKEYFTPCTLEEYIDDTSPIEALVAGAAAKATEQDKPLLLIVEDNAELRAFLRQYLKGDFRILEEENGESGLKRAISSIPDIIVSDIMMPVMNGLEMCGKLKSDHKTSHIPVVLLTARSSVENNLEGLNTGADDYICKPFHAQILEQKIKNLIRQRAALQKRFSEGMFLTNKKDLLTAEEKFLKKIMGIIENHLADPSFDVNVFAGELHMSRSVLYRKFKALTGQSVNELISEVRLKKAAALLELGPESVSEVAYEVGYSDPQYFSKCFRKKYCVTPSEYAAQFKSKVQR
ncbi:MAG: response regulator [Cyclobacteriaceae bacterium]|nr:response regulator [Cyclobacteriaceae bacterium]